MAVSNKLSFTEKKTKILNKLIEMSDAIDKSGYNSNYYKQLIEPMDEKAFAKFIQNIKEGKFKVHLTTPNKLTNIRLEDILAYADKIKCTLRHYIIRTDIVTGKRFIPPHPFYVLQLPIRRLQQFHAEKISTADDDTTIDGLTGAVTGDSRACSITNPEISVLASRNLDKTLYEFLSVRGGSIANYGEFRRSLEETGTITINALDARSKPRVLITVKSFFKGMLYDITL